MEKALIANVAKAKAVARSEVVNAGVACVSDDGRRVGVLVVVDATTGNVKQSDRPHHLVHRDHGGGRRRSGWSTTSTVGPTPAGRGRIRQRQPLRGLLDVPGAGSDSAGDDSGATDCAAG